MFSVGQQGLCHALHAVPYRLRNVDLNAAHKKILMRQSENAVKWIETSTGLDSLSMWDLSHNLNFVLFYV